MKERPIIFGTDMVKAIRDRRKTQTRRLVKPQPACECSHGDYYKADRVIGHAFDDGQGPRLSPYGKAGDRLWVRETMRSAADGSWQFADGRPVTCEMKDQGAMLVWAHHKESDVCSAIHMPRWASRITLEVVRVRVERLQEIDPSNVDAEGIDLNHYYCDESGGAFGHRCQPVERFKEKWDEINGKKAPWASNPWVWVIEFKEVECVKE